MKLFGYGTFITNGFYKQYKNVHSAFLPGYVRIHRSEDLFPFILQVPPGMDIAGFWGLVFEVTQEELDYLDYYESRLYIRIQVDCVYKDGTKELVMTYYPKKRCITQYKLDDYISKIDPWRIKIIKEHPDIIEEFPELRLEAPPRNFDG